MPTKTRRQPDIKRLSRALALRMRELKMSQVDLAQATGLSQGYISELMSGRGNPSLSVFVKIASVLRLKLQLC